MISGPLFNAWILALAVLAAPQATRGDGDEKVVVEGRAILLSDVLKERGIQVDTGPVDRQVVLKAADGSISPLLLDEASRALFQDPRLRNRSARVDAVRRPGLPYLQVLTFQVRDGDRYRTPEYWCEVCSISWRYDADPCPCCQGPMILRMKPDER